LPFPLTLLNFVKLKIPHGLKPQVLWAFCGAAKAAPFQNQARQLRSKGHAFLRNDSFNQF